MAKSASVKINGRACPIMGEANILELARKNGIDIPSFCYHSELSVYGACRMCLVDIEGMGLQAACSTAPRDGMVIETMTEKAQSVRRTILELLLANHDRECTTCDRNGSCKLQKLAYQLGVDKIRFGTDELLKQVDLDSPSIVRNPNKCILCGDCVRMCREVSGIGVLEFMHRGPKTSVEPAFGKKLTEVECVNCGQCIAVCPTGALTSKSCTAAVWKALHDGSLTVVAQIAPAVRVAIGEEFGLPPGEVTTGKIAAALRLLGFDYVFDTVFTADLTSVEETHEFVGRLTRAEHLPHLTSCCPGWVKFCEQFHSDMIPNLSTCRSPQQMFGSVIKRYWAESLGKKRGEICVVSIMPCTAKKYEAAREEFSEDGTPDVDYVLTTVELARMIKEAGIVFDEIEPESLDVPLGLGTGAGVIYGVTGGVAEAVLRMAYSTITGGKIGQLEYHEVRGFEGVKQATVDISGNEVRLVVVSGLANAEKVLAQVKAGSLSCHIIEVMACPGGCIGGGGQPYPNDTRARVRRGKGLYTLDRQVQLRHPSENIYVRMLYDRWLGEPGSEAAHHALHTRYSPRRRITGEIIEGIMKAQCERPVSIAVCVGTGCYARGSYEVLGKIGDLARVHGMERLIDIKATFCLERCADGVSIKVGNEVVTGVKPQNVEAFFRTKIIPESRLAQEKAVD